MTDAVAATAVTTVATVAAGAWVLTAGVVLRARQRPGWPWLAVLSLAVAAGWAATAAWRPLIGLLLAAWWCWALGVPDGRLTGPVRRIAAGVGVMVGLLGTVVLAVRGTPPDGSAVLGVAIAIAVVGSAGIAWQIRRAPAASRAMALWLASAVVLLAGFAVLLLALRLLVDVPAQVPVYLAAATIAVPAAQIASLTVSGERRAATLLVETTAAATIAALVAVVYLVVVAGINGTPGDLERGVLVASLAAAIVVAALAVPVRSRAVGLAGALIGARQQSTEEVVAAFDARMSRAVPMDELLLQLVESLASSVADGGAEIWTGTDGVLNRAVSMPDAGAARIELGERERAVVGRARIGGTTWAAVWLPELAGAADCDLRVVPIAHLGELFGLVVVRRRAGSSPLTDDDDTALVDLARQLGLALNNVRLDSALQASLAELERRNSELQASRLRIVAASDDARRTIERNLHDGAQQHLVALAVQLGLARQLVEDGETQSIPELLEDLRTEVMTTITELRELAHGIYPPLLRDRGLGEALRTAAARSPLGCSVHVDLEARYPQDVETAAYFCCLEAMQNAGKYAGAGAAITVRVGGDEATLWFEVGDDGKGFDTSSGAAGHGFVNMRDRLGALGGRLSVESSPGRGTQVAATIPARPVAATPSTRAVPA